MPQNWWELFPEIQPLGRSFGPSGGRTYRPNPFARRRPLPGPGSVAPGPAMALPMAAPYAAVGPDTAPDGAFDPVYFSGAQPGDGQFPGRFAGQAMSFGYPQPPRGRSAVVQQAAAAIRSGADPKAVRARLNQVGMNDPDLDPSNPFSDLMPGAPRVPGIMSPSDVAQREMLPAEQPLFARDPQKYSRQKGSAWHSGPTHLFTYGLPSFPTDNQVGSDSEPRAPRDSLPSDSAVHAAPVLNDHPLPYASQVEGDDIVVTGPPPAAREAMRQGARLIRLTPEDILNIKKVLQTEWVQRAGTDQARGIIDTILNRLASGHWGSTISAVVNYPWAFSAINGGHWSEGRHSVEEYPNSRVSRVVNDFVDAYLGERANGSPSIVGTNLNYANPFGQMTPRSRYWVSRLDGPSFGSGRAVHRHGTAPENQRYRPGPYSIVLPTPPGR